MTRIRYRKEKSGVLMAGPFETPNGLVSASIDPNGAFFIYGPNGETSDNNEPRPLSTAKKLVKSALIALQVVFSSEVRPRYNPIEEEKKHFDNEIALECNTMEKK